MALDLTDLGYPAVDANKETFVTPPVIEDDITVPESTPAGLDLADLGYAVEETASSVPTQAPPVVPPGGPGFLDVLGGTVETVSSLGWGALSSLAAQPFRHYFTTTASMMQKLGIGPKHTPEEIAEAGEFIAEQIQTFGGLAVPKTVSGQASVELVGNVLKPLTDFSHWVSKGVDPEKYPNVHNAIATIVEFGLFAVLPGLGRSSKRLAKKAAKARRKTGEAKVKAEAEVDAGILDLVRKAEPILKDPKAVERAYAKAEKTISKIEREAVVSGEKDLAARLAEQREAVSRRQGLQNMLERTRERATPVVEPLPSRPTPAKSVPFEFKTAQELLVAKEAKVIRSTAGKQLMDRILGPLKNEKGEIVIKTETAQRLPESEKAIVRRLAEAADDAKQKLSDFLVSKGLTKEEAIKLEELHRELQVERPNKSITIAKETIGTIEKPSELWELAEGEAATNPHRIAKGKVPVGETMLNAAKEAIVTETPWVIKGFTAAAHKFESLPKPIQKIWHRQRDANKLLHDEVKIHKKHVETLFDEFPDTKLQEEAGLLALSKTKNGADALQRMGKKVPEGPIAYQPLLDRLEVLYKDLFERINEVRVSIGKNPLKEMDNYTPFFQQESLYDSIGKVFKKTKEGEVKEVASEFNMVLDSAEDIKYRHSQPVMDATSFRHIKRGKLRRGVTLEVNPLKQYSRYSNSALKHIHMSPVNAFVKEFVSTTLVDPKTGQKYNMQMQNPELATFLREWSNHVAGKPNLDLPKPVVKALRMISNNLTASVLGFASRTIMLQPAALVVTKGEYGIRATTRGITDMMIRKKLPAMKKSRELTTRMHDASLQDTVNMLGTTGISKGWKMWKMGSLKGMSFMDYLAAESHWRTSYNSAKKANPKLSELELIRHADDSLVRTHGAGDPGAVSPIQRNALGKFLAIWQTFTINQANWLGKNVAGIKGFDPKSRVHMGKLFRFMTGAFMVNTVLQEGLGMHGAFPSPIKAIRDGLEEGDAGAAIALNALMEMGEVLPFAGSLLYGSNPLGAAVDFVGDISIALSNDPRGGNLIPKAMGGDKKAIIALAEIAGKASGFGGTRQIVKTIKGVERGELIPGVIPGRKLKKGKRRVTRRTTRRTTRRSAR